MDENLQGEPRQARRGLVAHLVVIERVLCEILLVVMALLITAETLCRGFLGFSLMITGEVSGYLLVAIAFLGMAVALGERALFRVEFLYHLLPGRARPVTQLIFDLLSFVFAVILDRQLILLVLHSYERGVAASTILATPLYLPQASMAAGITSVVVILVAHLVEDVQALRGATV